MKIIAIRATILDMSEEKSAITGNETEPNDNSNQEYSPDDEFLYGPGDDEVEQELYISPKEEHHNPARLQSLKISDTLRGRIAEYEHSPETKTQFRHRIALIGAVELDSKRQLRAQSGAWPLLEAFYQYGKPHWIDPIKVIMPIKEIMFKMQAPPMADRGIFYVLTRVARAGISPAAFAMHIVLPRMAQDYNWKLWRARHIWILDSIADLLVELRTKAPWNTHYLGKTKVLTDIALCKYVGRPLARLQSERIEEQKDSLAAWANAWINFTFTSPHFLTFLRKAILPCFYRLSGKIDPEQLAPMANIMSNLEKKLGKRFDVIPFDGIKKLIMQSGFLQTLEDRIKLRVNEEIGYLHVVRELMAYLELVEALSNTHAGLSMLREICQLSLLSEPTFLGHAAKLAAAIKPSEGILILRKHILALQKIPENRRDAFIDKIRTSNGIHGTVSLPQKPADVFRYPAPFEIAQQCGISQDVYDGLEFNKKAPLDYKDISTYLTKNNQTYAKTLLTIAQALQNNSDRDWNETTVKEIDSIDPALLKLCIYTCIAGSGNRYTRSTLPELTSVYKGLKPFIKTSWPPIRFEFAINTIPLEETTLEPYACDLMRSRINRSLFINTLRALTVPSPDSDCSEAIAELGKYYTEVSRALNAELSRAIEETQNNVSANQEKSDPHKDPKVKQLKKKQWILNELFKALEDVPVNRGDPRRFVLAVLGCAIFLPDNEKSSFSILMAVKSRYSTITEIAKALDWLETDADSNFIGINHAKTLISVSEGLSNYVGNDEVLNKTLYTPEIHFTNFVNEALGILNLPISSSTLEYAFRKSTMLDALEIELAKWRDLAIKLAPQEQKQHKLVFALGKGYLDILHGEMGGSIFTGFIDILTNPDTLLCRVYDKDSGENIGSCIFMLSRKGIPSARISAFWQFYAINIAPGMLHRMSLSQITRLYLGFRYMAEQLAVKSGFPVALCGITELNIVSSDPTLALIAKNFEVSAKAQLIRDAECQALLYPDSKFKTALLIIDPQRPETLKAARMLRK